MRIVLLIILGAAFATAARAAGGSKEIRIGMIGLDTSHVTAFTAVLNDPGHKNHVAGARVVAAFQGGSPDVEASRTRVEGFTQELRERYGVKLYPSIPAMCREVDAVMLESVDGRPHLAQALPVLEAGKPLFIDKPMAASLEDVLEIFRRARSLGVPVFSASSLRFGKQTQAVRNGAIGKVRRAVATSPCHLEPHHPELFWYGIHGVESLFTVMGTGCQTVQYRHTDDGLIEVTGTWKGGRTGIFRESPQTYGGHAQGTEGESDIGNYDGYHPLLAEVVRFFQTGKPPVAAEETVEIFAFMTAAGISKRQNGAPVALYEVVQTAKESIRNDADPQTPDKVGGTR